MNIEGCKLTENPYKFRFLSDEVINSFINTTHCLQVGWVCLME